jgi:hypothetical protein
LYRANNLKSLELLVASASSAPRLVRYLAQFFDILRMVTSVEFVLIVAKCTKLNGRTIGSDMRISGL